MRPRTMIAYSILSSVLSLLAFAPSTHALQSDGLTEAVYCTVHGRILTLLQLEWEDRLAVLEGSAKDDVEQLGKKLSDISAKYRRFRDAIYSGLHTSEAAFGIFGTENKDSIQQYLQDHPDIRANIDDVKTRVDGLIQQFESRMEYRAQDRR